MNNNSSNINVDINFRANTEAAKNNINSLQSLLTQITQTKNIGLDSSALGQAKASAQELQMHLENAVNVNTGKLDLGKFNASLKAAGSDLATLSFNLQNVGPVGQQAFMKLAKAIASAQTPMLNVSNAIAQFGKTLVNTVKWQLASNLIHGVQGALQAAVSHAKDLNSALNDIRIVTGYSIDRMSEFVNEARAASKELNTTTTEYAKASLIFFQQGLTGDAVKERTDVVIKMSQVTHESAEQISSELTAIWNNFDDGVHTLEWYADAITALGAATASSSKEIAQGLQKFAAVADTVGLSYEYATAALATVVAETRQSADIVGTSFKTIFSRLEGLKLGETLEDGTDLNKYSAALLTVGVNIKKANGDLKDMDEILDELGERWQGLGKDQQVALAQAVGGVRQYQQFIALADNWSKVQKNIEIARKSDGTLEKQQKIWSESFEAATKRVEEAKKQLYEDLVNDNALIKLNDIFSNLLYGIGNVVKSAGGIVPIIMMIIALLSNTLMPLVKNGINRLKDNIAVLSGAAQRSLRETQDLMRSQLDSALNNSGLSKFTKEQIFLTQDLIAAKQRLDAVSKNLSTAERAEAEMRYAIYEARSQELQAQLESLSKTEQEIKLIKEQVDVLQQKSQVEQALDKVNNYKYVSEGKGNITSTELSIAQSTTTESLKTKQESQLAASKKVQEEINQLLEKRRESENGLTRAEEKRLESLRLQKTAWNDVLEDTKRLLAVRRELDAIEKKEVKSTVTGMDNESMKNFSNRGGDVTQDMHNSIRSSIVSSVQGKEISETDSGPNAGSAEIQANAENLDVLAQKWGELTQIVTSAQQVMKDINTSITEVTLTNEELSQANEKVKEATDDVKKAEEALKKARKDKNKKSTLEEEKALQEARQKLTAATTRQKKAIEDNAKATKNFSSVQQQAKLAIHSLGESAGLSKDQLQQLDTSMDSIGKDTTPEQMGQILTPLIESCREAGGDVEALIQKMRSILDPENKNPEVFDNLINKAKEMGAEFVRTKQEEDKVLNPTEEPIAVSKFDKVSGALTGIAGSAAKVAMAYNGLKSVVNVWSQEDASIMEKIMTTFMSLSMIVPILTGKLGLLNVAKVAYNSISAIGNTQKRQELVLSAKKLVADAAESGSTWALVAAKIALAIAENGWLGIVLGAALIAMITMTTIIIAQTAATEKKTKAVQKQAKVDQEAAKQTTTVINAWRDQRQEMDNLIGAYKLLKYESGDYADTVQDIIDKTPDLIESYRDVGKELSMNSETAKKYYDLITELDQARATGDVDRIERITKELDTYVQKYGSASALKGLQGKNAEIATKTQKDHYGSRTDWHGNSTTFGKDKNGNDIATSVQLNFGSHNNRVLWGIETTGHSEEENEYVARLIAQNSNKVQGVTASSYQDEMNLGQGIYSVASLGFTNGETQGANVSIDLSDPYALYNYYQEMQKTYQQLVDEGYGTTQGAEALKEFLESNKDQFEELDKWIEENDKFQLEGVAASLGIDSTDIHSLSDYIKYQDLFIQKTREMAESRGQNADEAEAEARAYLKGKEYLSDYYDTALKLDLVERDHGKYTRQRLEEAVGQLTPEQQAMFVAQVDVNTAYTPEAVQDWLAKAQSDLKSKKLEASVAISAQIIDALGDATTTADWDKIKEQYDQLITDFGEDAMMSWEEFMKLNTRQQKAYLTQLLQFSQVQRIAEEKQTKRQLEDSRNKLVNGNENAANGSNERLNLEELKANEQTALQVAERARNDANNYRNSYFFETIASNGLAFAKGMQSDFYDKWTQYTSGNFEGNIEDYFDEVLTNFANAGFDTSAIQQYWDHTKGSYGGYVEDGASHLMDYINGIANMSETDLLSDSNLFDSTAEDGTTYAQYLRNLGGKERWANDKTGEAGQASQAVADREKELENNQKLIDKLNTELDTLYREADNYNQQLIDSTDSLGSLDAMMSQLNDTYDSVNLDAYHDKLISLANEYPHATNEVEKFTKALETGNQTLIAEAEDALRAAVMIGEAADKYDLNADVLEESANRLKTEYNIAGEAAARLAIRNARMNQGILTLNENFEDWKKTLKENTKESQDYAESITNIRNALRNVLSVSDDFNISTEFIEENLKEIEKAAEGDTDAIARLGVELAKNSIEALTFNDILQNVGHIDEDGKFRLDQVLNPYQFELAKDKILEGISNLKDSLKDLKEGQNITDLLGGEDWINALNTMAKATGMSVEEMNSYLNSLGIQAEVKTEGQWMKRKIPQYITTTDVHIDRNPEDPENDYTKTETTHTTVGKPIEANEYVEYASIGTVEGGTQPPLVYRPSSSAGGISKSSTPSKNKSSSSKKEKKDKKKAESETERYHEITALVEDYTRELDKAGKAKDRAFGPKKLKAMQAEIAAQAQLNAATEEHIREIREWLEIDKARIAAQGATFDEYGNISNYTELMQQHIDAYNAAVATYNASEQSDADKEAMEAADKAYQDFMDQLSQYEETNDLLQDKLDELIEAQQAKYDREFEMLQYTIEFKIEADDSILSYLDYMKNKIENFNDGVHDAVEMLATLNDEAATLMDKNSTYNRAIDDTLNHYLSNQGMGESDIQAFIDRFKANNMSESDMSMLENMTEAEYQYLLGLKDNLLEINNSLIENMNAVVETVQNSFSKTAEDLDKATRPIERAASALENYAAIIDIVGRDALGITDAIAAELDNAAVAVAHSATVAAKAKVDTLQSERDEVQRLYDEAMAQGFTEMAYKWKTVLEEMDDEIAAATDDFNSKWQEELTKAREAFENTVERIKQSMLDAFAGSIGSWSGLKDSLEYAKTAADRFVPQYKEIYELSKLNRDIMKSIDNTSNIKNKQALRDLQKEINELEQHSGEISQYDLDNARRRYELELARLQLEEARDAKSTVRLSKDAEGNWSYVYTANQEDVEKAEQNYEDKLYAMQQANNEYINSLSDQILELEEQYAEKLAEIRLDNTMSEEERNAAIERLNAYFAEQMEYLTNEGQKAVDNNARLFEEEWTTYHNWTDAFGNDVQARIDNQHDFMTQFGDTILGTYTGYGNFDELNAAMVQIAEEASVKMEEAYGALQAQVATAMEAAGIDVAHFGEVVHDTVNDQIVPSAQAAEDAVVEMGKAAVDEFKELTDGVSTWQTKYATEMQKIINKNEQLATSVNNLATAYANLVAQMYAAADAPVPKVPKFNNSNADGYIGTNTGDSGEDNNDSGDTEPYTDSTHWQSDNHEHWKVRTYKSGRTKKINKGHHRWHLCDPVMTSGHGHSPIAFESAQCAVCGKKISIDPQQPYAYVDGTGDNQEVLIPGYDTGGYTGNWNSSQGKLAVLHEKELVLNKDDTKNILGTVEMVRKLSQKIDLNAQTARYAFNYHPIINDPKPIDRELQVDQTVSITAEFPNVQNRTEIEEAFTTLINQASQFANRKS